VLNFGAQRVVALHSRHERHQLLHRHGDSGWDSIALARSFVGFANKRFRADFLTCSVVFARGFLFRHGDPTHFFA
jgi:hypothetical protein